MPNLGGPDEWIQPAVLTARFHAPRDLREACRYDPPPGTLFVQTTAPLEPGTAVVVDLGGRALPSRVLLRGLILARRRSVPRLRVRAGLTVGIEPVDAEKFRAAAATETSPLVARRHQSVRIPVSLPVELQSAGSPKKWLALLDEVWSDGALLRSDGALPAEGVLTLDLPPHRRPTGGQILSRVTRHGSTWIELSFLARDPAGFRLIHELIRRACKLGELDRLL